MKKCDVINKAMRACEGIISADNLNRVNICIYYNCVDLSYGTNLERDPEKMSTENVTRIISDAVNGLPNIEFSSVNIYVFHDNVDVRYKYLRDKEE